MKPALGPGSPSVILVSDLDDRMNWSWRAKPEVAVARRAEVLDQVLDDELPRYADALGRLGR